MRANQAPAIAGARTREAMMARAHAQDERARADEQRRPAEQAKETAQQEKAGAEAEKARADQTSRDLIAEADRASGQDLWLASYLKDVSSLAKETAARGAAVYVTLALNWATLMFGEFDEARRDLQQQAKTGASPKPTASTAGYVAVMQGDADAAALSGYVERDKDPIYLFDLADALAMRADHVEALRAPDAAVAAKNATPEAANGNIAPDIKAATHHREPAGYGDDVILAAPYMRTFVYAFEDRDAFDEFRVSLGAAADAYARSGAAMDSTGAVDPFLIAIDHGWLAARGQAISPPRLQAAAPQPIIMAPSPRRARSGSASARRNRVIGIQPNRSVSPPRPLSPPARRVVIGVPRPGRAAGWLSRRSAARSINMRRSILPRSRPRRSNITPMGQAISRSSRRWTGWTRRSASSPRAPRRSR